MIFDPERNTSVGLEAARSVSKKSAGTPDPTTADQIKNAFESMGSSFHEGVLDKISEYDRRIRAAQAGAPIKSGDTVENLIPDFKRFTHEEWTESFDIEDFKKREAEKKPGSPTPKDIVPPLGGPVPIEAATADKERIKNELRGIFESALNKLEPKADECKNQVLTKPIDSFDTREKINRASKILSEYLRIYKNVMDVLDSKQVEVTGALSGDEIELLIGDFIPRMDICEKCNDESFKCNEKLQEKKNHLPAEVVPGPAAPIEIHPAAAPSAANTTEAAPVVYTEGDLKSAREAYVKAKKELEKFGSLKSIWATITRKDTKKNLEAENIKAKEHYEKVKAEYYKVANTRFVEERDKFWEETIKQQLPERGKFQKFYDGYKRLGTNYNLAWVIEKTTGHKIENRFAKVILGAVNARTAITAGLLASSLVAAGVPLAAITGFQFKEIGIALAKAGAEQSVAFIGTLAARRAVSGLSSGAGVYELMNLAKGGKDRASLAKDIDKLTDLDEIELRMSKIEARVKFDGKVYEELKGDTLYQKLKAKRAEVFESSKTEKERAGQLSAFIDSRTQAESAKIDESLRKEKRYRNIAKVAGIGTGIFMAWGGLGKIFNKLMPQDVHVSGGKPFGAAAEIKPAAPSVPDIQLHAGSRGIEGAFLDLKNSDHEKYVKMLKWMNQQPGGNLSTKDVEADAGKIVHRFVDHFAKTNEYGIGDAGAKGDLNRMFAAGMTVHGDGSVDFDSGNFKFMPKVEHVAAVENADAPKTFPQNLTYEDIKELARKTAEEYSNLQQHAPTSGAASINLFDYSLHNQISQPSAGSHAAVASLETGTIESDGGGGSSVVESAKDATNVSGGGGGGGAHTAAEASGASGQPSRGDVHTETAQETTKLSPAEDTNRRAQEILDQSQKDAVAARENLETIYQAKQEANISQALQMHDLTQSLKLVYGDEYSHIFKLGHFKPSDLKKIQELNLQEVITHCAEDKKFGEKFKFIKALITGEQKGADVNMAMSLKEFLVKYSPDIKDVMDKFK